MEIKELKKEYRTQLAQNYRLRVLIGIDHGVNERTIQNWATGNSPKLVNANILASIKKHLGIDEKLVITETILPRFDSLKI